MRYHYATSGKTTNKLALDTGLKPALPGLLNTSLCSIPSELLCNQICSYKFVACQRLIAMDGVNVDFAGAKIDASIKIIEQIGAHGLDLNRHHLPYEGSALPLSDVSIF